MKTKKGRSARRLALSLLILAAPAVLSAGENLRINPRLDYSSDSQDGPLITGESMKDGAVSGKPNYIIFYGEGCFNSKRQARRTVSLYQKYQGRVQFVVVDLDVKRPAAQRELIKKYYRGPIPHITVLDQSGKAVYNNAGEVGEDRISNILDDLLKQ
jgi:hypothetical protein